MIPLKQDFLFKKVFGDENDVSRLEGFLSVYFHVPIEEIKGNVRILNGDFRKENNNSKDQKLDIKAEIDLGVGSKMINIEVNLKKGTTLERNLLYSARILSNQLTVKSSYKNIKPVIQINFDNYEINENNKRIIKRCFIKDEENTIVSRLLEIDHINIDKCKKAWYNKSIKYEKEEDKDLIRLGALLMIENLDDFKSCLEEIDMNNETKKNIEETVDWYQEDEVMLMLHDRETIIEEDRELARIEGRQEGIKEGIQEGKLEELKLIVNNLKKNNMSISEISKITEITEEEVNKLID